MGSRKICAAVATSVLIASLSLTSVAQTASNLIPYQSFIKAAKTALSVPSTLVSAFNATTVTCPASHAAGCTMRVRVSTQFTDSYISHFFINVSISGTGTMWPNSLVDFGYFELDDGVLAHSFEWMKTGVPAGASQTVAIKFRTDGAPGTAGYRLASIDCFLN